MLTVYSLSAFNPNLKGVIRDIRTVWTLEELGEKYERKVMDPLKREHKSAEYLAINPFGKVPAIKDGDFSLFESTAICTYLGDKHQKLIPMPRTQERAVYDQWVSFTTSTFEPWAGRVFGFDFFTKEKNETTEKMRAEALATVDGYYATLDKIFSKQAYLLGSDFSIADIVLSASSRFVAHTEVATKHASLNQYLQKNYQRPGFVRAFELNG